MEEEEARTQTQIRLRLKAGEWPGQGTDAGRILVCDLILTTNRPLEILSYGVKFRSVGVCHRSSGGAWPWRQERAPEVVREEEYARASNTHYYNRPSPPSTQPRRPRQPWNDPYGDDHFEREFAERATVHVGRALTTVSSYTMTIVLRIPRDAAATWAFSNSRRLSQHTAALNNLVQGEVTYRRLDDLGRLETDGQSDQPRTVRTEEQEVRVRNRNSPADRFGHHGVVESSALSNSWFRGSRGGITCLLTARDQLVVQGQDIPLVVQIDNSSSRTLHTVSLEFVQEATLTDPSREKVTVGVDRHTIMAATLPPVAPHSDWQREITHFTAPPNTMNSGSILPCTFAMLRFLVLLKVQWTWGRLQCCVEVKVGDRFSEIRRPGINRPLRPTNLQKHDLQTA